MKQTFTLSNYWSRALVCYKTRLSKLYHALNIVKHSGKKEASALLLEAGQRSRSRVQTGTETVAGRLTSQDWFKSNRTVLSTKPKHTVLVLCAVKALKEKVLPQSMQLL